MLSSTRQHRLRPCAVALALCLALSACSNDKNGTQRSSGGENAIDRAGHNINAAHQDFKRSVKPAARAVDEKTQEVIDEGKKGVKKTVHAVDNNDSSSQH